ncbi:MAG TPA: ABC transporter permease [Chryseosolibacter sp.]|nr:ABC transporter permease [Chryseosolibacter sp.]
MIKNILQDRVYALAVMLVIAILLTSLIFPSTFPTFTNFSQILLNLSTDSIVAVGMMLLLITGAFDLSVGSTVAFVGCLAAWLMQFFGVPVAPAIALSLAAGLIIGALNGYLIAYVGINPMIQTLAMMGIVRGLALLVSGSGIQNLPYWFNAIGQSKLLGIQMPVWYLVIVVCLFTFLLRRSVFFRRYYYIGANERAADLSGIRVQRMKLYSFVIMAGLASVAGILLSSRLGAALPTMGRGLELKVITAAILGGASLSGGSGKIPGALLGAMFMGIVSNIMVIARVSGYWQEVILGIILIVTLVLDRSLQKRYAN